jgi:hypothetical protein
MKRELLKAGCWASMEDVDGKRLENDLTESQESQEGNFTAGKNGMSTIGRCRIP